MLGHILFPKEQGKRDKVMHKCEWLPLKSFSPGMCACNPMAGDVLCVLSPPASSALFALFYFCKAFFLFGSEFRFLGSLLWFCLNEAFCVRLMPVGAMVIEIINEGLFNSSS